MAMHAAFGQPGAIRQASDTLLTMFTNRVENDNALGPQSHGVGPCSEGWLTSRRRLALQSTRSTATCPALRGTPHLRSRRLVSTMSGRCSYNTEHMEWKGSQIIRHIVLC